jgi:transcriptional regulator with XRE-family HTH domain
MKPFHFGERLKESKEISQEALGARLGVSQPRISDMERCRYLPKHDLQIIAEFLDTDIREITPKWWHYRHQLANWGRVFYGILLLSFGWDIYIGLVEHPLKIWIGILLAMVLALIYMRSIRK